MVLCPSHRIEVTHIIPLRLIYEMKISYFLIISAPRPSVILQKTIYRWKTNGKRNELKHTADLKINLKHLLILIFFCFVRRADTEHWYNGSKNTSSSHSWRHQRNKNLTFHLRNTFGNRRILINRQRNWKIIFIKEQVSRWL